MTKILVVEDEQSLREPLVYLLQKEGFDVVEAVDGNAALEAFERFFANAQQVSTAGFDVKL